MATLLHIITGLNTGGAERSLHNLLAGGLAAQHRCHVISLTDQGSFGPEIRALGVPVHTVNMAAGRPTPAALLRLRTLVRNVQPDLVQGWMYHGNLAASVARWFCSRRPIVAWNIRQTLGRMSDEKPVTRGVIRIGRMQSGKPDCIIYNSHNARARHENYGYSGHHATVIPNGFDTELWRPDPDARQRLRAKLHIAAAAKVVGYVGRFHPMKDIPTFLQAAAPLLAADTGLHCVMVGQDVGPENSALTDHFAPLPPDRTHVLGRSNDIAAVLAGIDVLCLCSRWGEAFPNVIGEAMACGVPCVATDVGDCRAIVGDTGRIVPVAHPLALQQALAELLTLDAPDFAALAGKARARIAEHFSLQGTVNGYLNLYESLLKGR